uniref:Uncharacterized protein n=1 Tax=Setaria digitata TaxID=48799 RepID=A0A915Q2Z3_9BILA
MASSSRSEAARDLPLWTAIGSGTSFSKMALPTFLKRREIGKRERLMCYREWPVPNINGSFTFTEKANLVNRFLPNRQIVIQRLPYEIFCCQYLPDGRLISSSRDNTLRFFYRQHTDYKLCYEYNYENDVASRGKWFHEIVISNSDQLTCPVDDGYVYCYSLRDSGLELLWSKRYEALATPRHQQRSALFPHLRYTVDDRRFILGCTGGYVIISDSENHNAIDSFKAHRDDPVNVYCFKTNPNIYCTSGIDGLCKVWDMRAERRTSSSGMRNPVGVFSGHYCPITFADGDFTDRYFLSVAGDETIKIWDFRRFSEKSAKLAGGFESVAFPPSSSGDTSVMTFQGYAEFQNIVRAYFSPERTGNRYVYTGRSQGAVHVLDVFTSDTMLILRGHRSMVYDCCWHPYDAEIKDGIMARWQNVDTTYFDRSKY